MKIPPCFDCGRKVVAKPKPKSQTGPYPKRCEDCYRLLRNQRSRDYRAANPWYLQSLQFKVTPESLEQMFQEQGGICACCKRRPATNTDHDYFTNQVRGIVCWNCNVGMGHLGDDAPGAHNALRYLALHEGAFLGAGL